MEVIFLKFVGCENMGKLVFSNQRETGVTLLCVKPRFFSLILQIPAGMIEGRTSPSW